MSAQAAAPRPTSAVLAAARKLESLAREIAGGLGAAQADVPQTAAKEFFGRAALDARDALGHAAAELQFLAGLISGTEGTTPERVADSLLALRGGLDTLRGLRTRFLVDDFPAEAQPFARDAAQRIETRLRQFAFIAMSLADSVLRPDVLEADGCMEFSLNMDLAHELGVIATQVAGAVPLWRYA